jgi:cyclopropane-fatty-acyl-phospholipid synthase
MSSSLDNREGCSIPDAAIGRLGGFGRILMPRLLSLLKVGTLTIELPSGVKICHTGNKADPLANITLHNWRLLRRLALHGDIGLANSYIDGDWSSSDLTALFELGLANSAPLMDAISGSAPFRAFNWLAHRFKTNTRRGSRRNIEAHYDLGNDFYRQWLDAKMVYSSALYESASLSLEEAQAAKLKRIGEKLELDANCSVLEIGCGWGALATSIVGQSGAQVTGVTISPSQLEWAVKQSREHGLDQRIDLRLQDYRDIEGRFDRIVSIEMIEAVGREFLPQYFETIRQKLKPGGLCVLQAITIAEDRFVAYCRRPDFIQRYIFPGGFLPTRTLLREAIEAAGLKLQAVETFGDSYALTLREWRRRFLNAWPEIAEQGFKPSFKRLWNYYLCYCEAGFRASAIDVGLYSLSHASE